MGKVVRFGLSLILHVASRDRIPGVSVAAAVLVAGVPRPAEVADAGIFRRARAAPVAGGAAVVEAGLLAGVDAVAGEAAVARALEAGLGVVAGR